MFTAAVQELRNGIVTELKINLRNTYEISAVLSIIRKHHESFDFAGTLLTETWPEQQEGHYLRGTKPVFYLVKSSTIWSEILEQELTVLRGDDKNGLSNNDIAVICGGKNFVHDTVNTVVERWNTVEDRITMLSTFGCASAEYAAVIFIYRYGTENRNIKLPNNRKKRITFTNLTPRLYSSLSRARVYSSVILYDYEPNICEYDDNLLVELRNSNDVCRVIER